MVTYAALAAGARDSLQVAHAATAAVQLATAVVLAVLTDEDARAPLYSSFPSARPKLSGEQWVSEPRRHGSVPLGYAAVLFLGLSAAQHLVSAWPAGWARLARQLERGRWCNGWRWGEYFFSASLMHVMVAQLCGVFDVHLLWSLFGLRATTMVFGALQERAPADDHAALWLGCWPWLVGWAVPVCYFYRSVLHAPGGVPDFVYAIIVIELVLDAAFAAWLALAEYRAWPLRTREWGFLLLSLTSKQALAWLNWGGTRML